MTCPFCDEAVSRPKHREASLDIKTGQCSCGALYVDDETGRSGGEALLAGLTMLCDGNLDRAMEMVADRDYQLADREYEPRTFTRASRLKGLRAFGRAKVWFFRRILAS